MADVPYFFKDSGLTQAFDTADFLVAEASASSSVDVTFYVGLVDTARKIQDETNPGVDPIVISIVDAATGSGVEAADIKLALTQGALAAAVAGDPVSLPATINGGSGNRAEVWARVTNNAGAGTFTDVTLERSSILESDL